MRNVRGRWRGSLAEETTWTRTNHINAPGVNVLGRFNLRGRNRTDRQRCSFGMTVPSAKRNSGYSFRMKTWPRRRKGWHWLRLRRPQHRGICRMTSGLTLRQKNPGTRRRGLPHPPLHRPWHHRRSISSHTLRDLSRPFHLRSRRPLRPPRRKGNGPSTTRIVQLTARNVARTIHIDATGRFRLRSTERYSGMCAGVAL